MINGALRQEGRIVIFHLHEDLHNGNVKAFMKRLYDLVEKGRTQMVLDLSEVMDVSLMGMVAISALFNKCRQKGGAFKVACLNPTVRRSFRNTNLINTIECYEELLEAVKSFSSQNLLRSRHYSGSFYLKERGAFVGWDRIPLEGYVN